VWSVFTAFYAYRSRTCRPMIGVSPEWALWVMLGLLAFIMLLPTIKR
jgi:hypothetical protein